MTVKRGKQWLWQEASQRPVLVGCMRDQQRLRRQCEAEIRIAIGTFFFFKRKLFCEGKQSRAVPEGLMGACVLPAEDLRTSLYIEGNDVGGGEKWKAQGRWNWEGEMNGT